MKTSNQPQYGASMATCSCTNTFTTKSTKTTLTVELCNVCHPFFTGQQRIVDSQGRVERFQRRYAKLARLRRHSAARGVA